MDNVEQKQIAVDTWWEDLTPQEQKNPVNVAKYETALSTLDAAGNLLNSLDGVLNDDKSATVQYSLNKRPKDMWNFVVGGQYQMNKHWMLRAEYGFLGSRQQFITGLQFRFGV
jgi:long-subunit fatty acid transport protein